MPRYILSFPFHFPADKAQIRDTKRDRALKQPHGDDVWDTHHAEVACDFFNYLHDDQNGPTVP